MARTHRTRNRILAVLLIAGVIALLLVVTPILVSGQMRAAGECAPQTLFASVANSPTGQPDAAGQPYAGLHSSRSQPAALVTADDYGLPLAQDDISAAYTHPAVHMGTGESLSFELTVPEDGTYLIAFDAAVPTGSDEPRLQLQIDGQYPTSDFERLPVPVYYHLDSDTFPKDRYGNDAPITPLRDPRWNTEYAHDVDYGQAYPLRVELSAGTHQVDVTATEGELYLGSLYLVPFEPYPDYADYRAGQTAPVTSGFIDTLEAELPAWKNDPSVRTVANRSVTVTPYDTYCLLMNTIGGDGWVSSGTAAFYEVTVPQDGLYAITLRAMQNLRSNFTTFRRITINGEVPFEQFNAVPFHYTTDWEDMHLGGDTPYLVHLNAGTNVIGIEATDAPYLPAVETIQQALTDINALSLEIKSLTGNQADAFREWDITDYIPDIEDRLNTIAQNLIDDEQSLLAIDPSGASPEILTYRMAIENLRFLASDPDKIPVSMNRLSEGTGSAAQQLATLLPLLQSQPVTLDRITVHSPDIVPETPSVPITTVFSEELKRFVHSFQPDPYRSLSTGENELEVWVNRPQQYVSLLQLMADSTFTPETGIPVRFSIMPDESKLILANAADIQPDVALGVSTNQPFELAIRNALYDLRSFPDFDSYISRFSPGALLGYIINDSVYAIPETQDFWMTFYRQDIFDALNLPVPQTWDEVIEILPELQRYGMNFSNPLSGASGQRGLLLTAPYFFNYDASLYGENGYTTGLESERAVEAIRFMADSFTLYGMPLTTANFYQAFRDGSLPIGVSNSTNYILLSQNAAELDGLWDIGLYPATVLPDGTENRWSTGSAQTSIMFANTEMPDEAWEFMKWWMSTETQVQFQENLLSNYGRQYLWFSANREAFDQLDIPRQHRDMIQQQWDWIQEPVRLPGSYMQEREISNIWNRIVFDGVNPRVAIDRSVTVINREIERKMEEFGYLQDGIPIREFQIPTVELVEGWIANAN